MFGCSSCKIYADEVKFLREELKRAADRLLALTDVTAYQAISPPSKPEGEFYGGDGDEQIVFGPMGQRLIATRKQ